MKISPHSPYGPSINNPSSRSSYLPFRPLSWSLEASGTAVGSKIHYSRQREGSRLNTQAITQPTLRSRPTLMLHVESGCGACPASRSSKMWALAPSWVSQRAPVRYLRDGCGTQNRLCYLLFLMSSGVIYACGPDLTKCTGSLGHMLPGSPRVYLSLVGELIMAASSPHTP